MSSNETVLLVDNGSTRPAATLNLRRLAKALSDSTGRTVYPVSLQHADRIAPNRLDGLPALTFSPFMHDQLEQGVRRFRIIPLFFGPSRALSSFIPDQVAVLSKEFGPVTFDIAEVLCPLPAGEPRLAKIALDNIRETAQAQDIDVGRIIVVDHGSPVPAVTAVREYVADELRRLLDAEVELAQAVMERRVGSDYDFNGPLVERQLKVWAIQSRVQPVILAMMFLLPGRHAGNCGDIEQICSKVTNQYPGFAVYISPLVADHPMLIEILQDRLKMSPGN